MECPTCNSKDTTKNEFIYNRKQRYVCKDCGRQFIENPPNKRIPQQLLDMVDKLLLEKIPIACRTQAQQAMDLVGTWQRFQRDCRDACWMPMLRHYGNHCHQSTVNALFVTLIFGLHMSRFFPKTDAVGKESGKTNRIERSNLTLRQWISRLVRKTLSFSKKIEAHIGAIWNFIHNYNAEIASKLAITTY